MNCRNCGAPLSAGAHNGRAMCRYCRTINILLPDPESLDRVIPLNQPGEHDCPACAQTLAQAVADDEVVECCVSCGGLLIEDEAFRRIVWRRRAEYSGPEGPAVEIDPLELNERRNCPGCAQQMDCHPYYGPGNAIIDACEGCGLIWLDAGELTVIERAPGQRYLSRPRQITVPAMPEGNALSERVPGSVGLANFVFHAFFN